MHHTVWKLSALAGVVGLGLLIVFQAHRGMDQSSPEAGETSNVTASLGAPGAQQNENLPPQSEPDPFEGEPIPTPASAKATLVDDDPFFAPTTRTNTHVDFRAVPETVVQEEPRRPVLSRDDVDDFRSLPQRMPVLESPDTSAASGPRMLVEEPAQPPTLQIVNNEQPEPEPPLERQPRPKGAPRSLLEEDEEMPALDPLVERPSSPRTIAAPVEEQAPQPEPLPLDRRLNPIQLDSVQDDPRPAPVNDAFSPQEEPRSPVPPNEFNPHQFRDVPRAARVEENPARPSRNDPFPRDTTERFSVSEDSPAVEKTAPQGAQRPQLTIEKIAPPNATVGSPLVYHILVRNVGFVPAHQVVVEDRVPRGVELKGTIPQAELDGARLVWKIGTLDPAREKKISVRIIPLGEGVVGSVATVNFSADVGAQTFVTAPKLHFDMTAPSQATLNAPIVFSFRIVNTGRGDANNVIIRDLLPAGMKHPDGDDLEYEIGAVPAGKSKEIQLTAIATQQGRAVNRAVVTADGGISVEAQSQVEVLGPSLTLSRTGPKRLFLNKSGAYRNLVTNTGANTVSNISIVETIPVGLEFVSATAGGTFDSSRRAVTWRIDRLDPGQARHVDITLTSSGRGTHVSAVRATDGTGASGETMGTTSVSGVAALALTISEVPAALDAGDKITCTVRVVNRGSEPATNVRLMAVVPHGMQLVAAKGPTGYQRDDDQLQFDTLPQLAPRGEATIEITLQARRPGEARIQAVAQSDQMSQPLRAEEATVVVSTQE